MRLLKLDDSGRLSLTGPFHRDIPEYAILSHTWAPDGEEHEVTYEDMVKDAGKDKPGYDKLQFCAKQALKHGLRYSWVDTCCINKSSSSELDEAIRSMFRWYSAAARCYVYLSDVPDLQDPTAESAFATSRWFTRGWTLQELVAPKKVEFFSRNGESLGYKESRVQQIHEITGIAIGALQGKPVSQFSIADRMSWAARRQTTREEDAAYCLLGILDIHIPVMYGEGRQNALTRLQREIQMISIPALVVSTDAPWIVPFERNPRFTGRETLLAQLEDKLFAKDHTTRIAIAGLGGVGKTQLALELLFRIKEKHKTCPIIWIPATSAESLHQGYLEAARQLGIPGWEDDKKDVRKLVQEHLSKESAGQWLLVFDNADDVNIWMAVPRPGPNTERESRPGSGRLMDYLPRNKQGCIIFTTRDRTAAVKLAGNNIIELEEMNEDTAVQLLKSCLTRPNLVENHHDTKMLLAELTYLPLAIVQAAAYINEKGIVLADYLLLLEEKEEEIVDLLSEDFQDNWRYHNVKNPVATTWLISFEQILENDPLAAEYLSFMACIGPKDIPQSLLPPGPSRKKEIDAIGTLTAYSFVSRRPADLALDLHRLVHLATRNWLRKEELLGLWMEKTITRLEEVFPDDDHENRSIWRMYLPHVRQALESGMVSKDEERTAALLWRYGKCLHSDGRWNEAEMAFSQIRAVVMRTLGVEHPGTLAITAWLASTYTNQGRWEEAEKLEVQVVEKNKTKLGADHPSTLSSIANLAVTLCNQGRWEEAEKLGVQVVETRKTKLGADHPSTLISMANLVATYRHQGRWEEAEKLDVQVRETFKTKLGADHPSTLTSMANLAVTYMNQSRWEEAEKLGVQVMETRKTKLGADHPETLTSIANLASTYWNQGRWEEAEKLEVQVVEKNKTKLGADHPSTLSSIANLAATYRHQGRWEEAEKLEVQVIETFKTKLGADHPSTLASMANLGVTYSMQGRQDKAEPLKKQVVETRKTKLGADHPSTLTSMANLASTYWNQGRLEEAEKLEVQVMETSKTKLGADHPNTLSSMHNLAFTLKAQGRDTEAIQLMTDCVQRRRHVLGAHNPHFLSSDAALTDWTKDGYGPEGPE